MKRTRRHAVICFFLSVFVLFPFVSSAREDGFALKAYGRVSPFLSGDAGSGAGAPPWHGAFDSGLGGGLELSYPLARGFRILAGAACEHYRGSMHEGISFDDLTVIPLYLGGKYAFRPGKEGWNPYLKAELGMARLSSRSVSYEGMKGAYWSDAWVFLVAAGGGLEYRSGPWGASVEIVPRRMGKPDPAMGFPSEADGPRIIPVSLGLTYYF